MGKIKLHAAVLVEKNYLNIQFLPIIMFEKNEAGVCLITLGWIVFAIMIEKLTK